MEKQIKKKILFINNVCYGSTGKICKDLYDLATNEGYECCIAFGRGEAPKGYNTIKIGNKIDQYVHVAKTRFFDQHGFGSKKATKDFLSQVDQYHPDIIHLHNIHGYYLNVELLFNYLKKHEDIKVVWTLHDCWAFTGHCAYYLYGKCYKWQNGCNNCQLKRNYPTSFVDLSEKNFERKKEIFYGLKNITVVCVSNWLSNEVSMSYLKDYTIKTILSGIDTDVFCFRESNMKSKYNIKGKKVILGVASVWEDRKGLEDFLELNKKLSENYQIILVGISEKQLKSIPNNIICIKRTNNQVELAELYSIADIYFNPSKEETYGLTNVEAQACGTTVVSYDSGGTKETLVNKNTYIVENVEHFLNILDSISIEKVIIHNNDDFNQKKCFLPYLTLYSDIIKRG